MDPIKIVNCERSHPGHRFPSFRSLDAAETEGLRRRIYERTGLNHETDGLTLVRALLAASRVVQGTNPLAEDFDMREVVERLGITPEAHVYINWYRYDQIDCLRFEDLAEYFDDVWYPSEDIEVFDGTLSWILFVMHYEQLRVADLTLTNT